jgi:hypothetical protein
MEKHEVIIHHCVICKADTDCYDSRRPEGKRKKFCVNPFTKKSCLEICPVPTHPRGGSFCEKCKPDAIKKNKQEVEDG